MSLNKEKHVRFWRMCAQTLPDHYTSNDSSRMTLGFFTISALDLLGALETVAVEERESWISWIYRCQVAEGGFRGFTGADPGELRSTRNQHWDPATIPATFFALATLLILGDDLSRVRRQECLAWLPKLQREDGSFGEVLCEGNTIEGDRDLRQCCCAAGIAYILKDQAKVQPTFDEERLIDYIQLCQGQSGGFGVSPLKEAHSGLSYCAIAALSFLQRLQGQASNQTIDYIPAPDQCIRWFLGRQTSVISDEQDIESGDESTDGKSDRALYQGSSLDVAIKLTDVQVAGFNGRDGKIADTCYAFWNTGALAILGKESLVDADAMTRYLLEMTQHSIGGFGKSQGHPPDILHAYLGLAALSLYGYPGIKALDPTVCISLESAARLDRVSWKMTR